MAASYVEWTSHAIFHSFHNAFGGPPPHHPQAPWMHPNPQSALWKERADTVKAAFRSAYAAYERTAYPHDELRPVSNLHSDNLNGWGASLMDSIDTMMLMRLDDLVERSLVHVSKLKLDRNSYVQFFETVIRYLGGLLSAYAISGNTVYLTHADELGTRLLPIFNTTSGVAHFDETWPRGAGGIGWMGSLSILSEFASCQMEYRYLAHLTGRPEYVQAVDYITEFLQNNTEHGGLFPLQFATSTGAPSSDRFSVGAKADSAYEYLLKEWLMTGKTEPHFLDMYLKSADAIIENMLYVSPSRHLLYVTDVLRPSLHPIHDFQHLSCFLSGLFALGTATIPDVDPRHAWAAEGLGHTCWITYADTATGLGPEMMLFPQNGTRWVDELKVWEQKGREGVVPGVSEATPVTPGEHTEYRVVDSRYLLRPETIESFYIMWRTTGDSKWRDRGWALFEGIENHAMLGTAYASLADVRTVPAPHTDELPSFFFAETLKYAYLLFTDEELIPLDRWVFNTEAHPIPIFTWSETEKKLFDIRIPGENHNNTTLQPNIL
ncbi:seven-hairpin glycosidase [Irpex lacteus]|nr:seven-hairpin glycosidase [Irpex lacteus]